MAGTVDGVIPKRRRPAAAQIAFAVEEPPVAAIDFERFHAGPKARAEFGYVARQDAL